MSSSSCFDRLSMRACLNIRVAAHFLICARCRQRSIPGRTDILGIARQGPGLEAWRLRPESLLARRQFTLRQLHIHGASLGVDHDDVAIPDEADRTCIRGFRPDMADTKAAGGTGET